VVVKLGAWQSGDGHGRHSGRCCSDRAADEWVPVVSDFSSLSKTSSNLKIKMDTLTC
jgi:hypothetical protein